MQTYKIANEPEILKRVHVRLVESEDELSRYNELIESHHYLGNAHMAGQNLRYVAELDGEWVCLLGFSAAALHLKAREKWIRWSDRQRARRLEFVVNNSRFLVLADRHQIPNLASRVLALCLRRLSSDWEEHWGHPVFLVESFVDESLFRGVCYRACGFEAVGATAGYSRTSRDFYQEHGKPKQLYLKALRRDGRSLLRRPRWPAHLAEMEKNIAGPCSMKADSLSSLLDCFKSIKDPRRGHGLYHAQSYVLACAAAAVLMGAAGYQAIEDVCQKFTPRQLRALGCRRDREGKYRPPSDSTIYRVLKKIDPLEFDSAIGHWLLQRELSEVTQLAIDGKTLRSSGRKDGKPLQLLSVVTHRLRWTLSQIPIQEKSNEIPAFPRLVRQLPNAEKVLITADAMHCQQESARVVTQELGWDYLFGLKGNQDGILERAQTLLMKQGPPP